MKIGLVHNFGKCPLVRQSVECLNKRQDKSKVLIKQHTCKEHRSTVRRFWVLAQLT